MKFCFGDMVVVEDDLIGVIVKDWCPPPTSTREPHYEVYVRYFNAIRDYDESKIERYMVRHKYLSEEEVKWQYNAVHNNLAEFEEAYKDFFKLVSNKLKSGSNKIVSDRDTLWEKHKQAEREVISEIKPMIDEYMAYIGNEDKKMCTRICHCLKFANLGTIDKLINAHPVDIKKIRNMGETTRELLLNALFYYCDKHGINTKYKASDYTNI